jgi:hypothetical protein
MASTWETHQLKEARILSEREWQDSDQTTEAAQLSTTLNALPSGNASEVESPARLRAAVIRQGSGRITSHLSKNKHNCE